MKTKTRYIVYVVIILILAAIVPGMLTNAKYLYNVNLESDVAIKNIIFKMEQKEDEPDVYEVHPNKEIIAKYELKNFDDDDNINETNLKYYIKITDKLNNENLPLELTIDGYSYISYNIDENGNIINSDGDITDELGTVLHEQNLTEEENKELQPTLQNVKKGYGPITLKYDGKTKDTKEIDIKINCSEEYTDEKELQFEIVIIAEGENINSKTESDLKIKVVQEESINIEEQQSNLEQEQEKTSTNEEQDDQEQAEPNANQVQDAQEQVETSTNEEQDNQEQEETSTNKVQDIQEQVENNEENNLLENLESNQKKITQESQNDSKSENGEVEAEDTSNTV